MSFEIKKICEVPQDLSDNLLKSINDEHWKIDIKRQESYDVHKFTETIRIRHVKDLDFTNFKFVNYDLFEYYQPYIDEYLTIISNYYEIKDYTALITNLKPGGIIPLHTDSSCKYFDISHRLHIPIKTNEDVHFTVGDTTLNMKVGEIYEIDNISFHSVENKSTENRFHIILDIFDTDITQHYEYFLQDLLDEYHKNNQ